MLALAYGLDGVKVVKSFDEKAMWSAFCISRLVQRYLLAVLFIGAGVDVRCFDDKRGRPMDCLKGNAVQALFYALVFAADRISDFPVISPLRAYL